MIINVKASSDLFKNKVIEVDSIEEAIKRLQTDRKLVTSVIDASYSSAKDKAPTSFIIETCPYDDNYDLEIEIYDYYRE